MKIFSRVLLTISTLLGLYAGWKAWNFWMGWGIFLLRGDLAALPVFYLVCHLIFPSLLCVLALLFGITGLAGTFGCPKALKLACSLGVALMTVSFLGLLVASLGSVIIFLLILTGVTRSALTAQLKRQNSRQQHRTPLTAPRPSAPRQTVRRPTPTTAPQKTARKPAPSREPRQPQPPERAAEFKSAHWRGEDPWDGPAPKDPWDL